MDNLTRPVLYGMPASLYTSKVRSYLRKQRIAFEERPPGHPDFKKYIVPKVGRWIIPVLRLPDGTVLQDGSMIIDYFEALRTTAATAPDDRSLGSVLPTVPLGPSAVPANPLLAALAHLFELFGGEGLLRSAMHYRWNFDAENLDFLRQEFSSNLAPGAGRTQQDESFAFASSRMRAATEAFGVNSRTIPAVEAATEEFLRLFDQHLAATPYLLGYQPSHGDYGLLGPIHAHLARDPHPGRLIKRIAPRVWRWVERMNAPDADAGEYPATVNESIEPEALTELLQFIAQDYLPEIQAHVTYANTWLSERLDLPAGTSGLKKPSVRTIGAASITWRGLAMDVIIMPYRLLLLQRFQDAAKRLDAHDASRLQSLLQATGLQALLELQCRRRVLHQDFQEVWGSDNTQ